LSEFQIITLKSGIKSLRSLARNETFHPTSGPLSEAILLHVDQQRLVERCMRSEKFVIWDVGFGAAANALAALKGLKDCKAEIEIHSFDLTTAPAEFALSHAHELDYLKGHESQLEELLHNRFVQIDSPRVHWHLNIGDFSVQMKGEEKKIYGSPSAIFYDPYSAATNPEMWTLEHFSALRNHVDPEVDFMWTNYTRSTAVRAGLLLAGFYVGKGCMIGEKTETTVASNRLDLLSEPLDRRWLERVRNSTNSAPLRMATYSKSKIAEADFSRLQACPQFHLKWD
jgi:tRNA U34 5-methylaminomethyl-2-thiouridine-forming methyltransferase MnmC